MAIDNIIDNQKGVHMQIETFNFKKNDGWSVKSFPKLDSDNTLILSFSSPDFFNNTKPFDELKKSLSPGTICRMLNFW